MKYRVLCLCAAVFLAGIAVGGATRRATPLHRSGHPAEILVDYPAPSAGGYTFRSRVTLRVCRASDQSGVHDVGGDLPGLAWLIHIGDVSYLATTE